MADKPLILVENAGAQGPHGSKDSQGTQKSNARKTLKPAQHAPSLFATPGVPPSVVTIGNFDGVHRGHQAVINEAKVQAQTHHLSLCILTFTPNPKAYFAVQRNLPRLELLLHYHERNLHLKELADTVIEIPFNQQLAQTSAADFFNSILIKKLNCRGLVVGYDFAFGKDRQGNLDTLTHLCRTQDIFFHTIAGMHNDLEKPDQTSPPTETISSSSIRSLLKAGQIAQANQLLGYNFYYESSHIVTPPQESQGSPNANKTYLLIENEPASVLEQCLSQKLLLPTGDYLATCTLLGSKSPSITTRVLLTTNRNATDHTAATELHFTPHQTPSKAHLVKQALIELPFLPNEIKDFNVRVEFLTSFATKW
jgi:riboflavin kinase/FMN adenylyltransferase